VAKSRPLSRLPSRQERESEQPEPTMSIRVRTSVPASSANLGPGYDILGLALDLRLIAAASPAEEWSILTKGEGSHLLDTCGENLIARAYRDICQRNGWAARPMKVKAENPIPIARGLGSSAAAIVTGMALAQLVNPGYIDKDILFREAAALEGHPDNVAAAVYGGLQEVAHDGNGYHARSRELSGAVRVLLVIPGSMKSTARLREIVPQELSPDVQAANDAALTHVLAGLAQGDPAQLRFSETDQRHQPYRLAVQPTSEVIFELLKEVPEVAGAFLSGAGTAVGGWVVGETDPTSRMKQALRERSISASVRLIRPSLEGVIGEIIE